MTRAKVCGITNVQDALVAVEAGADALGFIFYPKSPRFVEPETVRSIVAEIPPFVTAVGVFVNADHDTVERLCDTGKLGAIQLHGDEEPGFCKGFSRPVVRVIRVGESLTAEDLETHVEAGVRTFMLDTDKKGLYGGTGAMFDWPLAVFAKSYGRVILSGGLKPDNVAQAIAEVDPYAVDIGSGVEAEPGIKDHAKVKAFLNAVKHASTEN